MDAEALMAGGEEMLDRLERGGLIITGVASTAMRPEPTNGAVCSGATTMSAEPVRPMRMRERSGIGGNCTVSCGLSEAKPSAVIERT
jgi:hypothetical protein